MGREGPHKETVNADNSFVDHKGRKIDRTENGGSVGPGGTFWDVCAMRT